jgi:hypothetical protein
MELLLEFVYRECKFRRGDIMKPYLLAPVMLLFIAFGQAQSAKPSQGTKQASSPITYFDRVSGVPKEMFLSTLSKLKSEAVVWKKTWQISVPEEDRKLLIDGEINNYIEDIRAALADMDNSIAVMEKSPKVSEAMAITFDLGRIHENLANMSGLLMIISSAKDEFSKLSASERFIKSTSSFRKLISSTIEGVGQYRDGLQSYLFALGTTIDSSK